MFSLLQAIFFLFLGVSVIKSQSGKLIPLLGKKTHEIFVFHEFWMNLINFHIKLF